jgi:hypothetical protein
MQQTPPHDRLTECSCSLRDILRKAQVDSAKIEELLEFQRINKLGLTNQVGSVTYDYSKMFNHMSIEEVCLEGKLSPEDWTRLTLEHVAMRDLARDEMKTGTLNPVLEQRWYAHGQWEATLFR